MLILLRDKIIFERGFYGSTYFDASPCVVSFHHAHRGDYITRITDIATITLAGVQITATATIISVLTGLSTELAILICGAVLVIYTMSGGMWSVTMTDVIHFFVLVGGFSLAVPFVLHNVGGWESVVAKLPPEQLGFTKVGWKTIIGLIIMYFMTFSTGQESVQRYFAAKDEKTAVLGSIICGIIMALFAFVPAVLGLVALAEFPNIEANNTDGNAST